MSPKLTMVPARPCHVAALELRPQDHLEATLWLPGVAPKALLQEAITRSQLAYAVLEGSTPVALFGCSESEHGIHPWLMCSERVHAYPKVVIREGRNVIEYLLGLRKGKLLCNYVDSTNAGAKLLLKALGFVSLPAPGQGRFHFFHHPESLCASIQPA